MPRALLEPCFGAETRQRAGDLGGERLHGGTRGRSERVGAARGDVERRHHRAFVADGHRRHGAESGGRLERGPGRPQLSGCQVDGLAGGGETRVDRVGCVVGGGRHEALGEPDVANQLEVAGVRLDQVDAGGVHTGHREGGLEDLVESLRQVACGAEGDGEVALHAQGILLRDPARHVAGHGQRVAHRAVLVEDDVAPQLHGDHRPVLASLLQLQHVLRGRGVAGRHAREPLRDRGLEQARRLRGEDLVERLLEGLGLREAALFLHRRADVLEPCGVHVEQRDDVAHVVRDEAEGVVAQHPAQAQGGDVA